MATSATKGIDSTEATIEEPILVHETIDAAKATNTSPILIVSIHEMTKANDDEPNSCPCCQLELCTAQIDYQETNMNIGRETGEWSDLTMHWLVGSSTDSSSLDLPLEPDPFRMPPLEREVGGVPIPEVTRIRTLLGKGVPMCFHGLLFSHQVMPPQ
jgi:hypothetical protein